MRKTFRMYLTLALVMLGVMSVSAGDRIPVDAEHFTFYNHGNSEDNPDFGWGADAQETGAATGENGNFLLEQASGCPIGDTNCNAWIDLGAYSKMYVKMAGCDADGNLNDSNPRIFINRTYWNGVFNATKSASQALVIPNANTWAEDYYTTEADGTIVIDLTKIGREWGFVHFHSIKGSAWDTKAIVYSIEVEKASASQQIGWVNLINNSDMEGDDVSSFFSKINNGDPMPSEIVEGAGVDGSRGIKVAATAKVANAWDNQFWFKFNEPVPAGTKYRVSFDYRADTQAEAETQAHAAPSDYLYWQMFGDIAFEENWKTFTQEGEISAEVSPENNFQSVAFNLNKYAEANNYYFDNIKFEVYKYGTTVEFSNDVVLVDFGFDTNIPDLVKAGGKKRLIYPDGCATVKVNGETVELYSVEAFEDGRFYIFLEEAVVESDEVAVSFTNPTDEAYRILYTSGPLGAANNFVDVIATPNVDIENDGGYPYDFETPVLVKSDPEDGSFNLPTGTNSFKFYFDKNVDCAALVATVNGQAMTVTPSTGYASEVTLGCSALTDGQYTIKVTKIYPETRLADEIFGEESITVSVGKVVDDPNDVYEVVLSEDFSGDAEGWQTTADGGGWQPANSAAGSRIMRGQANAGMGYAPNILYVCSRGIPDNMNGTAMYGNDEEKLTLKAKTYHLKFSAARWDATGASRTLKAQVFPADAVDADGNADESQLIAEELKDITPDYKSSTDAIAFDIAFTAPAEGNYVLKFIAGNSNGGPGGYDDGIALGNVKIEYVPSTAGAEETRLLNEALENAKAVRDDNTGERYAGAAYDALVAAINKYEAEKDGYTAPSAYKEAAAVLNDVAQTMKDHRVLCAKYDEQIVKAIDVERQNKEKKFARTTAYAQVQALVAKYHGSSEWLDITDWGNVEESADTVWQLKYAYDVLMTDDSLKVAVPELEDIVTKTGLLFTEGASACSNTGVKVLIERLRLGAETLKSLGVDKDDDLIKFADEALTDNDRLAEWIKGRITTTIYDKLRDPNNEMFKGEMDEESLEEITPTYDMTVFVKNPNIYKQLPNTSVTEENVPGWITPEGFNTPGLTAGWAAPHNIEGVAEDCMFQTWGSSYRVEQTIEDLPAGVYTIKMGFGERQQEEEAYFEDSYIYAQTTDSEEPIQVDAVFIGQSYPVLNMSIENVVVTDGILTIGVNAGPSSHTFFNNVQLLLTGAAEGFDYNQGYVDGIEDAKAEQVRAIELYDLNGRRITTARQGVVIVKKIMSDGSVRTEKVVKK